ncbi:hypothetical protein Tco_1268143, partial [Tanacetum coccineum]
GGQQRGIISPFGAMHAGSSLLTGGQQRGIISPFDAMHAGSSLLTDGQQKSHPGGPLPSPEVDETLLDQVMKVFGDSTPEDKAQSGLEVCRSTKGIRKTNQKKTESHGDGDSACMTLKTWQLTTGRHCMDSWQWIARRRAERHDIELPEGMVLTTRKAWQWIAERHGVGLPMCMFSRALHRRITIANGSMILKEIIPDHHKEDGEWTEGIMPKRK